MSSQPPVQPSDALREALSALRDGAAHPQADSACAAWCVDTDPAREDWYAWAVIGDVLRSDDLAPRSAHDEALLTAVCARLAAEPVVLAPAAWVAHEVPDAAAHDERLVVAGGGRPVRAPAARGSAALLPWRGRASAGTWVAGAALVGAAVVAWRAPSIGLGTWEREPALASASPDTATDATAQTSAAVPVAMPGGELSPYLYAHRQYVQGPAMAMPGGLRPVALRDDSPADSR